MRKTYCDHCGNQIDNSPMKVEITLNSMHIEFHDLCRNCMEEYIEINKGFFTQLSRDLRRRR